MNRLIIVEGLPCSGKSTTTRYIGELLGGGREVCVVDEGTGTHPADYEFNAFVGAEELTQFSENEKGYITEHGEKICDGYAVSLNGVEGALFQRLLERKIYDFLPWEKEKPVMLERWRRFVDGVSRDAVYVFNCVLLQNPMCETMMRFGFSEEQSFEYISSIADIISPLDPLVVYLKTSDIENAVLNGAVERDGWLDGVIDYHVNGAYGRSVGAEGFDGYIRCLEERQRRELSILSRLCVDRLVVSDPHNNWEEAYRMIAEKLDI